MTRWLLDIWCCNSAFNSPDTGMLIIWHWYVILDTWPLTLDIWYRYLTCYNLILDTWHLRSNIWQLTCYHLILDICYHLVRHTWPDVVTPDWILLYLTLVLYCIFMIITFTGTWHDYYAVSRPLVLLNSCAPELLCVAWRLLILFS